MRLVIFSLNNFQNISRNEREKRKKREIEKRRKKGAVLL